MAQRSPQRRLAFQRRRVAGAALVAYIGAQQSGRWPGKRIHVLE